MTATVDNQKFAEYLTVCEAAEFLGVSPWSLRNWDNSGKLKSERHPINGYRIYRREDLEALLEARVLAGRGRATVTPSLNLAQVGEREHFVQFYETDAYLVESVAEFIGKALVAGDGGLIIATADHRRQIQRKLKARGVDVSAAVRRGQFLALDAAETLAAFMVEGLPDAARFEEVVGQLVEQLAQRWPRVRAFGEMVAVLWNEGNRDAVYRLEQLWNDLGARHSFSLFCAYPMKAFSGESDGAPLDQVCSSHARVIPSESYAVISRPEEQLRAIAVLQQKALALEAEIHLRKRAERELSDFVENALEGLNKVGPDGKIIWANKAEFDLLGYEPDEYIGHNIAEFHADREVIDDILSKVARGEEILNCPARLRCKDGSIKHVLIHSNGCFEDGKLLHSRCFTRDVTEIKQAERDRAWLAAIVESSKDAIVSKDLNGVITSWNRGAERLFGYLAEEAIGRPVTMLIPEDRLSEESAILDRVRHAERIGPYETLRRRKDGTHVHVSLTVSPIVDARGQVVGASKIAQDITDRKNAEDALIQADRRKDEFLATLAHELRNPLAPIRNSLHVLRAANDSNASLAPMYEIIDRQVTHMVRLVDDLMELSRIGRGKIELQADHVDLATILEHAIETSKPFIESAGHKLKVSLPDEQVTLYGDLVRLTQVFANLLNNAAKYTNRGGEIAIGAVREGNEAVVTVRDTGIGIPSDMLSRVFDMFAQVSNPLRRSQDGLGIGLSLVRTLVSLHGGRVEAHSEGLGRGSEFVVRLPVAKMQSTSSQRSAPSQGQNGAAQSTMRRVLLVDDNRDAANSLGMLLKVLGADVHVTYDGQSALESIRIFRPSVILLDIGMPGMDGYEVARRVRRDAASSRPVLIALTGWGQEDDRRRALEAGFDHHLVKPVDLDALQALLASLEDWHKTEMVGVA